MAGLPLSSHRTQRVHQGHWTMADRSVQLRNLRQTGQMNSIRIIKGSLPVLFFHREEKKRHLGACGNGLRGAAARPVVDEKTLARLRVYGTLSALKTAIAFDFWQ